MRFTLFAGLALALTAFAAPRPVDNALASPTHDVETRAVEDPYQCAACEFHLETKCEYNLKHLYPDRDACVRDQCPKEPSCNGCEATCKTPGSKECSWCTMAVAYHCASEDLDHWTCFAQQCAANGPECEGCGVCSETRLSQYKAPDAEKAIKRQVPPSCFLCDRRVELECHDPNDLDCIKKACGKSEALCKECPRCLSLQSVSRRTPKESVTECSLCHKFMDRECVGGDLECEKDVCAKHNILCKDCLRCPPSAAEPQIPSSVAAVKASVENVPEPCILCKQQVQRECKTIGDSRCTEHMCALYEHCEQGTCPVCQVTSAVENRAPVENIPEPCLLCEHQIQRECLPIGNPLCTENVCALYEHCQHGTCPQCQFETTIAIEDNAVMAGTLADCNTCRNHVRQCFWQEGLMEDECRELTCKRYPVTCKGCNEMPCRAMNGGSTEPVDNNMGNSLDSLAMKKCRICARVITRCQWDDGHDYEFCRKKACKENYETCRDCKARC